MIYEIQPRQEDILDDVLFSKNDGKVITIFLAGTIDLGNSVDWQDAVISYFKENWKHDDIDLIFYNPRRDRWGNLDKDEMKYQIEWELERQERCDINFMNILGTSKSPISLMEIGAFKDKRYVYIACPEEFYRFDNVRVFCQHYLLHHNYEDTSIQKICDDLEKMIEKIAFLS